MRKVRGIEIANRLGISKSTVSLALNDKPGVNQETKDLVFAMKRQLENGEITEKPSAANEKLLIKIMLVSKGLKILYDSELDLWTDVLAVFDKLSKEMGYSIGLSYVNLTESHHQDIVDECNDENVAGIILFGTEIDDMDYQKLKAIEKPMIIYDNDFEGSQHHRVCIDNAGALKMAMNDLVDSGCRKIHYIADGMTIYNFTKRREGYREYILHSDLNLEEKIIISGQKINDVYEHMKVYLEKNPLPDAFLMENYQVSIGVLRALREKGLYPSDQLRLIGIDDIPSYLTGDIRLTTIKIAHTDRAKMVMMLLKSEMERKSSTKFKMTSDCVLIKGDS